MLGPSHARVHRRPGPLRAAITAAAPARALSAGVDAGARLQAENERLQARLSDSAAAARPLRTSSARPASPRPATPASRAAVSPRTAGTPASPRTAGTPGRPPPLATPDSAASTGGAAGRYASPTSSCAGASAGTLGSAGAPGSAPSRVNPALQRARAARSASKHGGGAETTPPARRPAAAPLSQTGLSRLHSPPSPGPTAEAAVYALVGGVGGVVCCAGREPDIRLLDAENGRCISRLAGHTERVWALARCDPETLASGGSDKCVRLWRPAQSQALSTLKGHKGEVCGMKWSPDGATLASGGNDNMLCLWDHRMSATAGSGDPSSHSIYAPRLELNEHQAAVKALAWAPFKRNLLASGGGTADRCIKFWNTDNGSRLNSIDTGSQVCSLMWSPNHKDKEILSSHGYSENQLCLWKYPTMQKIKELNGHSARVLHLAQAPDGVTVCSAAADETLRFWRVFSEQTKGKSAQARGILNNMRSIR